MSKFLSMIGLVLAAPLLVLSGHAHAASWSSTPADVCPAPNGGDSGDEGVAPSYLALVTVSGGVVTGNTGCNDLIVFNSNGSVTTTQPNIAGFYDAGGDDNLVGVINNTSHAITGINLSSTTTDIFGFEQDGICGTNGAGTATPGYTFVEGNACTNILDPNQYGGPGVKYSTNSGGTGTVFFTGNGIAPGGSAFFSLEGPTSLNLTVTTGVPEPATLGLLTFALTGLGLARRRRHD